MRRVSYYYVINNYKFVLLFYFIVLLHSQNLLLRKFKMGHSYVCS